MIIHFERDGDLLQLESIINILDSNPQVTGIMIYTCDNNTFQYDQLNKVFKQCKTHIFGGIFPSILYNATKYDIGSIIIGFETYVHVGIIHNIHEPHLSLQDELSDFSTLTELGKTFFINIDGLSEGVESFREELFYTLGLSKNYIGGGAGSLSFTRKPCVITNEGILQDAAVIALVDISSGIGVSHGWEDVSEPMKVTESNGNHIISLNWEPALDIYHKHIEFLSGQKINHTNFFEIAKAYPFGISKIGNEMVVRDPIAILDDTSIVCVGAIPQNTFVYILNGNTNSLIEGAKNAKRLAKKAFFESNHRDASPDSTLLFIDCVSRALFLEDHFQQELDIIGSSNVIGALTLGEIANTGKAYLELYNKTTVIGILED